MTAICSNDGLVTTAHRNHVPQICATCDSVPLFYGKLLLLSDISRTSSPDLPTDHIPNVLDGVKVRRDLNPRSLQKRHSCAGGMTHHFVLIFNYQTKERPQYHVKQANRFDKRI